ncbi:DUF885 family protein [Streptomyces sp. SAJ15]|uniref:DUF885 family protein n=1 Tax=Streptomyces sp. SAJ15 TaxID=2011095 RepID=UPI001642D6E6|nr:DUF885 family protein [Streptomyces sp. SAJ15]
MPLAVPARLRAVLDASVPAARHEAGRHEYDGCPQDLSEAGVGRALRNIDAAGRLAPMEPDPLDEGTLAAFERAARVRFGDLAMHRRDASLHIDNLDLSGYDHPYAPADLRARARRAHLDAWPDLVANAVATLDRVPAEQARAALPAVEGLRHLLRPAGEDPAPEQPAARALDRLRHHLRRAAETEGESPVLGEEGLTRMLMATEGTEVDLQRLAERADTERLRLRELLEESCRRIRADATVADTLSTLDEDHPTADGLLAATREAVRTVRAWAAGAGLVPGEVGECTVGLLPESQGHQVATMTAAAPEEPDRPGRFLVRCPPATWSAADRDRWLRTYSRFQLLNIAVHEVAPGHLTHGRVLRRNPSVVRRGLRSYATSEGWAHYCEEMALEAGFGDGDPRYAAAVARDALLRLTRLRCVIGMHTGELTRAEAAGCFRTDAFSPPGLAAQQALRCLLDPQAGDYARGKFAILDLRDEARRRWGSGFSPKRFHTALLGLGAPPLGLLPALLGEAGR